MTTTGAVRAPERLDQEVRTADGAPAHLASHLYLARGRRNGILQVLIHGNSYDHRYWDAGPVGGRLYSYAHFMTGLGHDVLALDLPGTGDSSRPGGDAVGLDAVGDAIHALVRRLGEDRSPLPGPVERTALVGHSLGTIIAVYVQAGWGTADVVVGTGTGYAPNRFPSPFGPGVRELALSTEYAALPPEERGRVFYHPPATDPAVIEYDNRVLRTTLPRRLWAEGVALRDDPERSGVSSLTCPVYLQLGEFDQIMPGSLAAAERAHWPEHCPVRVEQIPDVGHSFNLHRDSESGWRAIDRFLRG